MADVRLKIVHKKGSTHVEDDAGNRIWGVQSIKWEIDETNLPVCTIRMLGVSADIEAQNPIIRATPVTIRNASNVNTGPIKTPVKKKKPWKMIRRIP